jgi:hypothetical protein
MSHDHKPVNRGENNRIVAAGGFVEFGRVNGEPILLVKANFLIILSTFPTMVFAILTICYVSIPFRIDR